MAHGGAVSGRLKEERKRRDALTKLLGHLRRAEGRVTSNAGGCYLTHYGDQPPDAAVQGRERAGRLEGLYPEPGAQRGSRSADRPAAAECLRIVAAFTQYWSNAHVRSPPERGPRRRALRPHRRLGALRQRD